jgi:hypothetical protein
MLENFRGLRKFLDDHRYASDFIEKVRSHHEGRESEEHEVDGQEDYLFGGFSNPPKSYLRELRALRG